MNNHIAFPFAGNSNRWDNCGTLLRAALAAGALVLASVLSACGPVHEQASPPLPLPPSSPAPAAERAAPVALARQRPSPAARPGPRAPSQPCPAPAAEPAPVPALEPVDWKALPGWEADKLNEVWPAFLASCDAIGTRAEWREPCTAAKSLLPADNGTLRAFFESRFVPNRVVAKYLSSSDAPRETSAADLYASSDLSPAGSPEANDTGLVTGYYEPLLRGSRSPGKNFSTPLYGVPDDLLAIDLGDAYPELRGMRLRGKLVESPDGSARRRVVAYPSRAELDAGNHLRGKEIVWVDSAIDAFYLQVQGSGRVQIYDRGRTGETVRLAYADQNGRPYKSIGRYLVDLGEMTLDQVSMQAIKDWAKSHPERLSELLNVNPSVIFFKETKVGDPAAGPIGALGVSLTPGRSIAVDPKVVPLGAPVFLATTLPGSDAPLRKLTMAQDTGGAVVAQRGSAVRADYFWGFGAKAGEQAGRMKQEGRMWVLLPR